MNKLIIFLLGSLLLTTCHIQKVQPSKGKNMNDLSNYTEIINRLDREYYGDIFNYVVREEVAGKVLKDAGYKQLVKLVNDRAAPMKVRFFTCEVLEVNTLAYRKEVSKETLAKIYATALANNYTGYANSWGFLYEHNDEGTTGIMFLELWHKALPPLEALLDDETQYDYEGSREAMVGNAYRFRVKDFAAYYISKITRIPVAYKESHEDRDKEIKALKEALKTYTPN